MVEIVLHIGRHKTGTTALQQFLSLNEDLLLMRDGVLYPRAGRDNWKYYHHSVFRDVIEDGQAMNSDLVAAVLDEATRVVALPVFCCHLKRCLGLV